MKKDIHPEYREVIFWDISSDYKFITRSTVTTSDSMKWENAKTYPLFKIEISSASHPFYLGKKSFNIKAGRVEKFNQKYKKFFGKDKRS